MSTTATTSTEELSRAGAEARERQRREATGGGGYLSQGRTPSCWEAICNCFKWDPENSRGGCCFGTSMELVVCPGEAIVYPPASTSQISNPDNHRRLGASNTATADSWTETLLQGTGVSNWTTPAAGRPLPTAPTLAGPGHPAPWGLGSGASRGPPGAGGVRLQATRTGQTL